MSKKKKSQPKIKLRSGFESVILRQLDSHRIPYKYEESKIAYQLTKYYVPDIELPNGIIIECKGEFNKEDRDKMLAVKQAHPELDIRMVFQSDGYINKLSKNAKDKRKKIRKENGKITLDKIKEMNHNRTKYSDWCIKNGLKFSIGKIPLEWLEE